MLSSTQALRQLKTLGSSLTNHEELARGRGAECCLSPGSAMSPGFASLEVLGEWGGDHDFPTFVRPGYA